MTALAHAFMDGSFEQDHLRGCHYHDDHECPCATCGHDDTCHVSGATCWALCKHLPGSPGCSCELFVRILDDCDGECTCADLAPEPDDEDRGDG